MQRSGTTGGGASRLRFLFPGWLREFFLVAAIYAAYEASRGLHTGAAAMATRNGQRFLDWERDLHIAPEHVLTQALVHVTPIAVAAAYFYSTMHYVITPIVLVWLYAKHRRSYPVARTTLAISTIIGLIGFYFIPTAPPRLLAGAGVPDALYDVRNWGWWGGEGSVPRGIPSGFTNQFAAMPSMHVGWALWCGVLIYRHSSRTWVRWLGVAYPIVTTLVVISTGNHYLIDAFAGALVMGMGYAITVGLYRLARHLRAPRAGQADSEATSFQPATSQPATSQPATSQPATSQPATSQPATSQPATSQPATSQPATSQPATAADEPQSSPGDIARSGQHAAIADPWSSTRR